MHTNGEYLVRNERQNERARRDAGVVELLLVDAVDKMSTHESCRTSCHNRPTYRVVRRVCIPSYVIIFIIRRKTQFVQRVDEVLFFPLFSCYYRSSWVTRELQELMRIPPSPPWHAMPYSDDMVCGVLRVMHAKQKHVIKYIFELKSPHPHCRITVSFCVK